MIKIIYGNFYKRLINEGNCAIDPDVFIELDILDIFDEESLNIEMKAGNGGKKKIYVNAVPDPEHTYHSRVKFDNEKINHSNEKGGVYCYIDDEDNGTSCEGNGLKDKNKKILKDNASQIINFFDYYYDGIRYYNMNCKDHSNQYNSNSLTILIRDDLEKRGIKNLTTDFAKKKPPLKYDPKTNTFMD